MLSVMHDLFIVMLNVVMLNVVMLSVVMLSVVMLSVVSPKRQDFKSNRSVKTTDLRRLCKRAFPIKQRTLTEGEGQVQLTSLY
jgi:hypothetical protein